mmetsp:Transcript_18694/g.28628  ORF Transcript_18694/g.28628 Transcript_18694/m.28628 type:complete len:91 (-) Transcript_18694:354-626(-)
MEVTLWLDAVRNMVWFKLGQPTIDDFGAKIFDEMNSKKESQDYLIMIIVRFIQSYLFNYLDRLETESVFLGFNDSTRAAIDAELEELTSP